MINSGIEILNWVMVIQSLLGPSFGFLPTYISKPNFIPTAIVKLPKYCRGNELF